MLCRQMQSIDLFFSLTDGDALLAVKKGCRHTDLRPLAIGEPYVEFVFLLVQTAIDDRRRISSKCTVHYKRLL